MQTSKDFDLKLEKQQEDIVDAMTKMRGVIEEKMLRGEKHFGQPPRHQHPVKH
jgi:hypothetical protein